MPRTRTLRSRQNVMELFGGVEEGNRPWLLAPEKVHSLIPILGVEVELRLPKGTLSGWGTRRTEYHSMDGFVPSSRRPDLKPLSEWRMERDGSLDDTARTLGVEMISPPRDFDPWAMNVQEVMRLVRGSSGRAGPADTHGTHIHISLGEQDYDNMTFPGGVLKSWVHNLHESVKFHQDALMALGGNPKRGNEFCRPLEEEESILHSTDKYKVVTFRFIDVRDPRTTRIEWRLWPSSVDARRIELWGKIGVAMMKRAFVGPPVSSPKSLPFAPNPDSTYREIRVEQLLTDLAPFLDGEQRFARTLGKVFTRKQTPEARLREAEKLVRMQKDGWEKSESAPAPDDASLQPANEEERYRFVRRGIQDGCGCSTCRRNREEVRAYYVTTPLSIPVGPNAPLDSPRPRTQQERESIGNRDSLHPGYDETANCNCDECCDGRAIQRQRERARMRPVARPSRVSVPPPTPTLAMNMREIIQAYNFRDAYSQLSDLLPQAGEPITTTNEREANDAVRTEAEPLPVTRDAQPVGYDIFGPPISPGRAPIPWTTFDLDLDDPESDEPAL